MKRATTDIFAGYKPIEFSAGCELTTEERACIEAQRRDLWRGGVRTQPQLDSMAFEFAAVVMMFRAPKKHGLR